MWEQKQRELPPCEVSSTPTFIHISQFSSLFLFRPNVAQIFFSPKLNRCNNADDNPTQERQLSKKKQFKPTKSEILVFSVCDKNDSKQKVGGVFLFSSQIFVFVSHERKKLKNSYLEKILVLGFLRLKKWLSRSNRKKVHFETRKKEKKSITGRILDCQSGCSQMRSKTNTGKMFLTEDKLLVSQKLYPELNFYFPHISRSFLRLPTDGVARISTNVLPPYAAAWEKDEMSLIIWTHGGVSRRPGTFWRTLYQLSYRAAAWTQT